MMPASQEVEIHRDWVTAEVKPKETDRDIYFTDESPEFTLSVSNHLDADLREDSRLTWSIAVGDGYPDPYVREHLEIPVPANETVDFTIGGEQLAFEGHGIVGLSAGGMGGPRSDEPVLQKSTSNSYNPALSFSIWDREHYDVIHRQPKRTQELALLSSVAVVILAIIQVSIALEGLLVGFVAIILVISGYWEVGNFERLLNP
ncbi:hypothetical protein E6P09_14240 [Haloferax mediterranei ATCC 33500]|uniref:Uncharacterized protein n=1 Tax=Haloferax mediterranei (strain ATCC 33500 / DSM 1411 / JCM 8866 / NBRC 14739 / NCIMB 2177 / R-4) TaxID=523841 RepID=M0IQD1_HALMT|nr:hypothetical protein [Haloferax mediterranei]AHZ23563.1 hypothetical protein BM92_13340 [Haloferax mediterranei ATCC 33500]ELZ99046.1 hypothetical protein C439_14344 [Haloferax mediterranei ATCC 33500]MDX5987058.1 hypothetical protein [Haloferax mediterranei ATCC 33500]QCQ76374.1 hypothetical protein E6P09_14240 [Haloferax mediterranei ATCC 33500]